MSNREPWGRTRAGRESISPTRKCEMTGCSTMFRPVDVGKDWSCPECTAKSDARRAEVKRRLAKLVDSQGTTDSRWGRWRGK